MGFNSAFKGLNIYVYHIQIKRRKWNWIGHTLRKEAGATEKTALDWNPQGYRRRGRVKRTW